jgi:glycolate oxidase FAD binding subunit
LSTREQPDTSAAFSPSKPDELRAFLVDNFSGAKRPIVPVGGGTSFEYGPLLRERTLKLATRGLDRVVEFAARDMTITVEAGISIARLDEVLRGEGLRLPIDIPQWDRATLGGALAANTSGPRRFGLGTFRDYVIGLTAIKVDGQVFHSGGRVVKNVAGYDLCKLLVGSMGTLAIVTQVTLKLKPLPEASALVCAAFANLADREATVAGLLKSETRPVAIDTLNAAATEGFESRLRLGLPSGGPALIVGYEGTQRETDWQIVTLLNEMATFRPLGLHVLRNADAGPLWAALIEFPIRGDEAQALKAQVSPSKIVELEALALDLPIEVMARAGNGEVFGKLKGPMRLAFTALEAKTGDNFLRAAKDHMRRLFAQVDECGGSLPTSQGNHTGMVHSLSRESTGAPTLMRRLKTTFDPENLLNPLAVLVSR